MIRGLASADELPEQEQKRVALGYVREAWIEALTEGVDSDCLVQVCLFTAMAELVQTYGEEAAAEYAEGFSARIRNGEFSIPTVRQ